MPSKNAIVGVVLATMLVMYAANQLSSMNPTARKFLKA